ncbi:MAG: A/G-specific adenine glycosylase, partial [Lentisphaeria bacterium]|nr:A/G-specific adenine glycosylase [Lentisphaeria bacterium]NQZ70771.1 A/G-specific adenine glycosylase [Lentisphaeria bacterium]
MDWQDKLLRWYDANKREMPWRNKPDAYRTWISEIMLQQTQVDTVIPYFERFIKSFTGIKKLADADTDDVLKHWEGLGYYSRARNLHKCARLLRDDYNCKMPKTYEELLKLPGFGRYTAAAVASIANFEEVAVVDGNVLRVYSRLFKYRKDVTKESSKLEIFEKLNKSIKGKNPSSFNQGMMELGAVICKPSNPHCPLCPLNDDCKALQSGLIDELPNKPKKKKVPVYKLAVAVISKNGDYLLQQRADTGMLAGLWEFPGGKVSSRKNEKRELQEKLKDQLGIEVSLQEKLGSCSHSYSHFKVELNIYGASPVSGRLKYQGLTAVN